MHGENLELHAVVLNVNKIYWLIQVVIACMYS